MQNTEGGSDALLAPVPYAGEAPRAEGRNKDQIPKPEREGAAGDSRTPSPKPAAGDQPFLPRAGVGLTSSAISVKVSLGPRLCSLSRMTVSAPLV